ncbi:putative tRNA pseudouridine synthase Pus10 [Centruroides sculpturatus]|uniref:putative tRNA pseudouridine synthase Pus10 n=1 Tax=Centruroides sculpturatus TaxID=218467 RepID=UPI000C6CC9CA|nr:putative tRNA pseudouridine synthase Pus10 [Centruroides sculpturatus]
MRNAALKMPPTWCLFKPAVPKVDAIIPVWATVVEKDSSPDVEFWTLVEAVCGCVCFVWAVFALVCGAGVAGIKKVVRKQRVGSCAVDEDVDATIQKHITDEHLSFLTFVIQLSIPVTIDLRERLLFLYLQEKYPSVYGNINIEDLPTVKDVWKWVIGSQLGKSFQAEFNPDSSFQIAVSIQHTHVKEECEALEKLCPDAFPNRRKKEAKPEIIYTRTAVHKALSRICTETLKTAYTLPPCPSVRPCYLNQITCIHSPIYLAGRYNKYSRQLSQTPWIIDGDKRMMTSVQELIVDVIKEHIKATKIIFSASGREDVDVRMLGSGNIH